MKFKYEAIDSTGLEIKDTIEADKLQEAARKVFDNGFYVTCIQAIPTYEPSENYSRRSMNQYVIKTHDNHEIPLQLFVEAPDKEIAIAKVQELEYFPESVRQLNVPQLKPKMNPTNIILFVVMIIIQLGFIIWNWTK